MDDEGFFYFCERKKEMIRVGGENVAAREVEMILNQHPKIAESAVIGKLDESRNETIKAFLVLKSGIQITPPELIEYCQKKMAKFKVPKEFEIRADLPRTAAGKIDKKALRKLNETAA
jgi:acyl-CoA synthetase (AMP-forming)/AMP-acid ligase II